MAALTAEQLATLRNEVGSNPDDATLQSIYDRTEGVYATAYEVVAQRLADMRANPAQFSVSGEYGQNVSANLTALNEQLRRLRRLRSAEAAGVEDPDMGVVTIHRPARTWAR